MRTLKSTDLFAALRIVKEIGVKDEMKRMAESIQGVTDANQTEVGIELLMSVLANCGTEGSEKAFYSFLSGVTEVSVEDLRNMDLTDFADLIKEFVQSVDVEHWRSFFTQLAGLIKKQN